MQRRFAKYLFDGASIPMHRNSISGQCAANFSIALQRVVASLNKLFLAAAAKSTTLQSMGISRCWRAFKRSSGQKTCVSMPFGMTLQSRWLNLDCDTCVAIHSDGTARWTPA